MVQRFFALSVLLLTLAACAAPAPKIDTDYNQEFNFSQVKTYAFVAGDGRAAQGLYAQRMEQAIEEQMLLAGYNKVDANSADVLVSYFMVGKEKQDVRTYNHGTHFRYGRYRRYGCIGCGHTSVYVQNYTEGTLVIEVVDRANEQVVWRSVTKERMEPDRSPDQREALIRERIALMFQQYPPY